MESAAIDLTQRFYIERADCLDFMRRLPNESVDLTVCSPPYEAARLYAECQFKLRGQEWVDWMVDRVKEMVRITKGLVAIICEGQTRQFRWSAAPVLLMADLHRAGIHLRKPPIFHRVGIPGSGGPDYWRNDYEFIVVCSKGGKLPWSDNTATGHPPKWAPGGAMSHMLTSGARVNQWGRVGSAKGMGNKDANGEPENISRPSRVVVSKKRLGRGNPKGSTAYSMRRTFAEKVEAGAKLHTKPEQDGSMREQAYLPPVKANPGNVIKCAVGGGQMGSKLAHENEAPFPESLVTPFVLSFCPPDGLVFDAFSGSGTSAATALKNGRRFIGCDIRESQVELTKRRCRDYLMQLF